MASRGCRINGHRELQDFNAGISVDVLVPGVCEALFAVAWIVINSCRSSMP